MNISAASTTSRSLLKSATPESLVLLAVVLFGFAVRADAPGTALAAIIGTAALVTAFGRWATSTAQTSGVTDLGLLAAILAFAALGAVGWAPSAIGRTTVLLERLPAVCWGVLATLFYLRTRRENTRTTTVTVTIVTLLLTLVVGLLHLDAVGSLSFDVNHLHAEAAGAIADGENPYTDAVTVPDGSPLAEPGATITGYPYPPITALAYAAGEWSGSEPRYTSLVSWLLILGLLGGSGIRAPSNPKPLYLMLLLAALPGWPLILRAGWTEPLSLLLFSWAFLAWNRPLLSGLALGLGLGSKQYFVVTGPLPILHRDPDWIRRLAVAGITATLAVGVAVIFDLGAFWSAAVEFHASTPPRPDSSNLVGLLAGLGINWAPPTVISVVVGLVAAVAVGRHSNTRNSFALATAIILSVSFLVSAQAFANYWFLITGLCVLALNTSETGEDSPTLKSTGQPAN